jgi:hypothetical protein
MKLSSGGRAESLGTPRNQHRGRRLLQRLVRPGKSLLQRKVLKQDGEVFFDAAASRCGDC